MANVHVLYLFQGSESEHNQAYWQAAQYIGVGPGQVMQTFIQYRHLH